MDYEKGYVYTLMDQGGPTDNALLKTCLVFTCSEK